MGTSSRSIYAIVSEGINSLSELKEALESAMRLEFSTIPPYLCAQWSVKDQSDPVVRMIRGIVVEEMFHLGLACNMLKAIGGQPRLAYSEFVPTYPTNGLPGDVHPGLKVELAPLSKESLRTFMAIEQPEQFAPAPSGGGYATIGDFYDALAQAFVRLQPEFVSDQQGACLEQSSGLMQITSADDALKAIRKIKEQGEGTILSPEVADFDPKELSHYYSFRQIAEGRAINQDADGKWSYDGEEISIPEAYSFFASAQSSDLESFNATFSDMLRALEKAWTDDPAMMNSAFACMKMLHHKGLALVQSGVRPEFRWSEQSSL